MTLQKARSVVTHKDKMRLWEQECFLSELDAALEKTRTHLPPG